MPARPERAEAPSPGQHPGYKVYIESRPERAKALEMKVFALSGRFYYITLNPGRCPGLGASALSGRAAK